jgi:hypothetical protein
MKVGITGHQRLESEDAWEWVQQELEQIFQEESAVPVEAYSSLAIGADQRFALVAIDRGAQLHVIVPCSQYEGTFKTQDDLGKYLYLISKASTVDLLDYPKPSEDAFMAAGKKIIDTVDLLVAVWNGEEAPGTGGTDDAVAYALNQRTPIIHLNPVTKVVRRLPKPGNSTEE